LKKILLSLFTLGVVAIVAVFATQAFFSDTETSTGNLFQAGALDLKVDNTCYYNKLADGQPNCPTPSPNPEGIVTTWEQTDLGLRHKFFWFDDVKPGDYGEDTISLHVDNDAWLRLLIVVRADEDVDCTGPESAVGIVLDPECGAPTPTPGAGELQENLLFSMWLDQGVTPGFQGPEDLSECDNDRPGIADIDQLEPIIISEGPIDPQGETWELEDFPLYPYLKAGDKACFGVAWRLPSEVGNEVQTDRFLGDMTFQVQQHRNNPTPTWTP